MDPQKWPKGHLCCNIVPIFVPQLFCGLQCYVETLFYAFFLNYVATYFANVAIELS